MQSTNNIITQRETPPKDKRDRTTLPILTLAFVVIIGLIGLLGSSFIVFNSARSVISRAVGLVALGMSASFVWSGLRYTLSLIVSLLFSKAIRPAVDVYPPSVAEKFLWFVQKEIRDVMIGDLEEEFHLLYDDLGSWKAILWYYRQIGSSCWPLAVSRAKKLMKWGVASWVGGLFRRIIS